MNTGELRIKAKTAIDALPPKALEKLVELLEEVQVLSGQKDQDELIERIINENRGLLMRLAEHDRNL